MPTKTQVLSTKLTVLERQAIADRATEAGLKPSEYARRELLASLQLSREGRLVLASLLESRQLMLRLFEAATKPGFNSAALHQIAREVEGIDFGEQADFLSKTSRKRPAKGAAA